MWSFPCSVSPVLLEQTEEGSPCVLMLQCSPCSPSAISRLLVISEARTMEVYSQTGEYCGTVRGEREDGVQTDRYTHTYTVRTSFACSCFLFTGSLSCIFICVDQFCLLSVLASDIWFSLSLTDVWWRVEVVSPLLCSQFRQRAFL